MRRFLITIGSRTAPRLSFECMAADSCTASMQHMDLCEPGERLEARAI